VGDRWGDGEISTGTNVEFSDKLVCGDWVELVDDYLDLVFLFLGKSIALPFSPFKDLPYKLELTLISPHINIPQKPAVNKSPNSTGPASCSSLLGWHYSSSPSPRAVCSIPGRPPVLLSPLSLASSSLFPSAYGNGNSPHTPS
jgi:hypothetical protein